MAPPKKGLQKRLCLWLRMSNDNTNNTFNNSNHYTTCYGPTNRQTDIVAYSAAIIAPTTITVIGLRLSNHWEPPTTTTTTTTRNSKLHERAEIEQNSENKRY